MEDKIKARAYQIYTRRIDDEIRLGIRLGNDVSDYLQAEKQIEQETKDNITRGCCGQ